MRSKIKTYSELMQLNTFEERFMYLKLNGRVGEDTFGFDRYLNQALYTNPKWLGIRNEVILRDGACDLGHPDREVSGRIYVHHMNPITVEDILNVSDYVFNKEYLITTSMNTHNAIHYGDNSYLRKHKIVTRTTNDQSPWRNKKGEL